MSVDTYFENIPNVIISQLNSAKQSIYIFVSAFTDKEMLAILKIKAKNGIDIHLLTSTSPPDTNDLDFNFLNDYDNCNLYKLYYKAFAHFTENSCLIDENILVSGSYKWTTRNSNILEFVIVQKQNENLAKKYIKKYNSVINDYFFFPHDRIIEKITTNLSSIQKDIPLFLKKLETTKDYSLLEKLETTILEKINIFSSLSLKEETNKMSIHKILNNKLKWWNSLPDEWKLFFNSKFRKKYITDYISDLTIEDILSRKKLDISKYKLTTLKGIEGFSQLEELDCSQNQLFSLNGIQTLTNLKQIKAQENQIDNLDISHKTVEIIDCFQNKITQFSSTANLPSLKKLRLGRNQLKSISNIPFLNKLTELNLIENQINDLTQGLKNIPNLEILELSKNGINCLDGVEELQNLQNFTLNSNLIFSLEPIDKLSNLQSLNMTDETQRYSQHHYLKTSELKAIKSNGGFGKKKMINYKTQDFKTKLPIEKVLKLS
jgi:Leucine-rich repeat (LRR) protein